MDAGLAVGGVLDHGPSLAPSTQESQEDSGGKGKRGGDQRVARALEVLAQTSSLAHVNKSAADAAVAAAAKTARAKELIDILRDNGWKNLVQSDDDDDDDDVDDDDGEDSGRGKRRTKREKREREMKKRIRAQALEDLNLGTAPPQQRGPSPAFPYTTPAAGGQRK
jgi:hypothetical protein